jgi:hypothetical protein
VVRAHVVAAAHDACKTIMTAPVSIRKQLKKTFGTQIP